MSSKHLIHFNSDFICFLCDCSICMSLRYLPLSGGGDGGHVEQLTGVILNSAEHYHSDGGALLLDHLQDVLRPQSLFSLSSRPFPVCSHILYWELSLPAPPQFICLL